MWFDINQDKWIWEEVANSNEIPIDQRRAVFHIPVEHSRYWISETGMVNIRLSAHSAQQFSVLLDSATLFETDELLFKEECLVDCAPEGGDGIVDLQDFLAIIAGSNNGASSSDVYPPCGDGKVDVHDLLEAVNNWGMNCQ